MKKVLFWVLGIIGVFFLLLLFWLKLGNGVLFWLNGESESGLRLTSRSNLFQYLTKLEKSEKVPFLILINFNDYVSQDATIYRRLEPKENSPIIFGCDWKKNYFFWRLNVFIDKDFLNKTDIELVNQMIGICFSRIFNEENIDSNKVQIINQDSLKILETINQGIIFKK